MRKTILSIFLSLPFCSTFALPATEQSTQSLIQFLDENGYFELYLDNESILKQAQKIMTYHKIPETENNKKRVFNVLKNHYSSPEFRQKYYQIIASVYQESSTEEEIQQWIKFYSSDLGGSILKNKSFMNNFTKVIEDLFTSDYKPSKPAQEKMEKLIKRFSQQID